MTILFPLKLYTTTHCHLCEDALAILTALNLSNDLQYIDIAEDDALVEQFGTRIPVLENAEDGSQLDWPFTKAGVLKFIRQ